MTIYNCRFFKYCEKKEFNKDAFLKNLYWQKQKGFDRIVNNNQIMQHGYFDETTALLASLIHGYNHCKISDYKKETHVRYRYTASDAKRVFDNYPYLKDIDLLKELIRLTHQESVVQTVLKSHGYYVEYKNENYLLSFLSGLKKEESVRLGFRRVKGDYYVDHAHNNSFLVKEEIVLKLKNKQILISDDSVKTKRGYIYKHLSLCNDYEKSLYSYKKEMLKEKMNKELA